MFVVAVFSSGWQLIVSYSMSAASMTTCTRRLVSFMSANGVTDPGATPSTSARSAALPKLKRRAPSALAQRLEVDPGCAQCDDEEQLAAGVLQKQVLGVAARQVALELGALGNREYGTVLGGARGDAERGEPIEQILA